MAEPAAAVTIGSYQVTVRDRGPTCQGAGSGPGAPLTDQPRRAPWTGGRIPSAGRCREPGPGRTRTDAASTVSPQDEQVGTTVVSCWQVLCSMTIGGPSAASHRSPHSRMAVRTSHRSRPLSVSR